MDKLALIGGEPSSPKKIPLAKPIFDEKTISEVAEVLSSGYVRQGPKTKMLEERYKDKTGANHAYAVNSGTAALHVAYLSILKPGDEVIAPSFTFIATVSTIIYSRGKPIFADIDPESFIIDPEDVKEKITPKTKAIAPVHLFGNAADMRALGDLAEDHKLLIVNDSAQAHGTEVEGRDIGSYKTLNCYSFYPSKSMTTGEGGMVTTNDKELYRLGCLIRSHGTESKYNHIMLGLNYRMTDIAATIGLNQLETLDENLIKRREIGKKLQEEIVNIEGLNPQKITKGVNHSYSYFSLLFNPEQFTCTRNKFIEALEAENISCAIHYPIPLTKQPAITELMKPEETPISEMVSKCIFSLPMHPELTKEDLKNIIKGVEKVVSYYHI